MVSLRAEQSQLPQPSSQPSPAATESRASQSPAPTTPTTSAEPEESKSSPDEITGTLKPRLDDAFPLVVIIFIVVMVIIYKTDKPHSLENLESDLFKYCSDSQQKLEEMENTNNWTIIWKFEHMLAKDAKGVLSYNWSCHYATEYATEYASEHATEHATTAINIIAVTPTAGAGETARQNGHYDGGVEPATE